MTFRVSWFIITSNSGLCPLHLYSIYILTKVPKLKWTCIAQCLNISKQNCGSGGCYSPNILPLQHHSWACIEYPGKCEQPTVPEALEISAVFCPQWSKELAMCIWNLQKKKKRSNPCHVIIAAENTSDKPGHAYTRVYVHTGRNFLFVSWVTALLSP